MKLAKHIIVDLDAILNGIRYNRIEDKAVKSVLLKEHLALHKVAIEAMAVKDEITRKFQEDWMEEIAAIEKARAENKPICKSAKLAEAEADANNTLDEIFSEEVDIDITAVDKDAVLDNAGDITFGQIAYLVDNGIIE